MGTVGSQPDSLQVVFMMKGWWQCRSFLAQKASLQGAKVVRFFEVSEAPPSRSLARPDTTQQPYVVGGRRFLGPGQKAPKAKADWQFREFWWFLNGWEVFFEWVFF